MRTSILRVAIFALLTCLCFTAASQTAPTWNWVQQIGGTGFEYTFSTVADASGNIYQTGSFNSSMQVGNTVLTSAPADMYLVKYNRQGVLQWAQQGHVQNANGQARAEGGNIATDAAGNVYVSGVLIGTVTFGSIVVTAPSGTPSTFVVKFTSQGTAVWGVASSGTGTGNRTDSSGLAVNANGEVFVSGAYKATIAFGNLSATSQGDYDAFLMKLNAAGVPQWLRSAGGTGVDYASALTVAPGNGVYLSGSLSAVATFGSLVAISRGGLDAFLMQYDGQGTPQWLQTFGGSGDDGSGTVVTVPSGELYTVGYFQSTADFGTSTLISQGGKDGFVVKCTAQGVPLWAKAMGGSGNDSAFGASWGAAGVLYVSGTFTNTASFSGQSITSVGGKDIFAAQYDAAGNVSWVESCGGPIDDESGGIAAGTNGTVFLGGYFRGTVQFGPLTLASRGSYDSFIVQLQDNTVTGLRNAAKNDDYRVYPNPLAQGAALVLAVPGTGHAPGSIDIIDLTGKVVHHQIEKPGDIAGNQILIGQLALAPGIYLLKYSTADLSVFKRIQVQ